MAYEPKFLSALLLTVFIETVVLFPMIRYFFKYNKEAIPARMIVFAGITASFATLPYVWFVFPYFLRTHVIYVIASEGFAFTLEAVFYHFVLKVTWKRAFILSFVCNGASFSIGLLLGKFFP